MISRVLVLPLVENHFVSQTVRVYVAKRAYSQIASPARPCLFPKSTFNPLLNRKKELSSTRLRRFAAVVNSFDPRQQDRESDEVDVCIVGGGTFHGITMSGIY